MHRRLSLFAIIATSTLLLTASNPGPVAKPPQATPMLVAMTDNPFPGGAVAIADDGGIYIGQSKIWTRVGVTPSAPAGCWTRSSTGEVFIALKNGDLYRLEANRTLTYDSNVFTSQ
jgi:hypothetical protein